MSTDKQMSPQATQLLKVHDNISNLIKANLSAMPEGFNETRFIQNAISVLQDVQDIENMEPKSVARCLLKGAFLDLDFFMRDCYAIPYKKNIAPKGKPAKYIQELNFQTDYKGEIKLVKKYALRKINEVYAKVVRQDDQFETGVKNGHQFVNFIPKPFSDAEIVGVFAVCDYADGALLVETMTTADVNGVRDTYSKKNSNGEFSPAWRNRWGEQAKKTVLRLLCKLIQIEFGTAEASEAFKSGSPDFAEFTDVSTVEAPIATPQSTGQATGQANGNGNGDTDNKLLQQIIEVLHGDLHGDNMGDWLEKETKYEKGGKKYQGVRTLEELRGKQPVFVFRAARKELVMKAEELAVELYPEQTVRHAALGELADGIFLFGDMPTATQVSVYETLFERKLDKMTTDQDAEKTEAAK